MANPNESPKEKITDDPEFQQALSEIAEEFRKLSPEDRAIFKDNLRAIGVDLQRRNSSFAGRVKSPTSDDRTLPGN